MEITCYFRREIGFARIKGLCWKWKLKKQQDKNTNLDGIHVYQHIFLITFSTFFYFFLFLCQNNFRLRHCQLMSVCREPA